MRESYEHSQTIYSILYIALNFFTGVAMQLSVFLKPVSGRPSFWWFLLQPLPFMGTGNLKNDQFNG